MTKRNSEMLTGLALLSALTLGAGAASQPWKAKDLIRDLQDSPSHDPVVLVPPQAGLIADARPTRQSVSWRSRRPSTRRWRRLSERCGPRSRTRPAWSCRWSTARSSRRQSSSAIAPKQPIRAWLDRTCRRGFEIKTAPGMIFIVGHEHVWGMEHGTPRGCRSSRAIRGVRRYYPGDLGRFAPKAKTLAVPPVWLADAPAFRLRENWPVGCLGDRGGCSCRTGSGSLLGLDPGQTTRRNDRRSFNCGPTRRASGACCATAIRRRSRPIWRRSPFISTKANR